MAELTDKQFKTRWADIKKQIKERPLLAYRVGIPLDDWDNYMHSIPSKEEINRIYHAIREDRKNKTLRIKENLSKIVGYRESKEYSKKSGVSDTMIRDILETKKDMVGYDVINRLEIFLCVTIPEFELSIENPLDIKNYTKDSMTDIVSKINNIADNLKYYSLKLTKIVNKQEKEKDYFGEVIEPSHYIESSIERLEELKNQIDLLWETYIEK